MFHAGCLGKNKHIQIALHRFHLKSREMKCCFQVCFLALHYWDESTGYPRSVQVRWDQFLCVATAQATGKFRVLKCSFWFTMKSSKWAQYLTRETCGFQKWGLHWRWNYLSGKACESQSALKRTLPNVIKFSVSTCAKLQDTKQKNTL